MLKHRHQIPHGLFVAGLVLVLVLGLAGTALAVEFRGGDTITIGPNEVIDDDLVIGAQTVIVDGTINGDLVAAGARLIVNGKVKGSLIFAGQSLTLNGSVGGTVYGAGAALTVGPQAQVERNLFFAGYSYSAQPGSVIGHDSVVAGYQASLNGAVKGNLRATVGALELTGRVDGNVEAYVEAPSAAPPVQFWGYFGSEPMPPALQRGLRVGPEAFIGGKFIYTSPVEQANAISAKPEGGIVYRIPEPGTTGAVATPATPRNATIEWLWARLREFVSLLVMGGLALWLLPTLFNRVAERTQVQPWLAGAWGLLVGIAGYAGVALAVFLIIMLVAGLAALTLAGLAASAFGLGFSVLGLAFTVFSLLAAYGSKLVVLYPLTNNLLARFAPQGSRFKLVPLTLGILLFVLLRSIPYLGVLLEVSVTVVGLGAMWLTFHEGYAKPAPPPLVLAPI